MPKIIKYYLEQDPILDNVETLLMTDDAHRAHVIDRLAGVRRQGGGGVGRLRHADRPAQQRRSSAWRCASGFVADPRNYIAQPVLALSTAPCFIDGTIEPRHVDLRPYVLFGEKVTIAPGGLTRVALRKGSLVVNSSQGGGSKDTWVLQRLTGYARCFPESPTASTG